MACRTRRPRSAHPRPPLQRERPCSRPRATRAMTFSFITRSILSRMSRRATPGDCSGGLQGARPTRRRRAVIATQKCRSPRTFRSSGFDRTTISRRRGQVVKASRFQQEREAAFFRFAFEAPLSSKRGIAFPRVCPVLAQTDRAPISRSARSSGRITTSPFSSANSVVP